MSVKRLGTISSTRLRERCSVSTHETQTSSPGTMKLHSTFGFFDENRSVLRKGSKEFMLTGGYQRHSIDATAPATAVYCWIAFRLSDGSGQKAAGTLFLDDARLIGASVEPPPPLMPRVVPVTLPSDDVPIASLVLMKQEMIGMSFFVRLFCYDHCRS
jgi:hypothetical protein